MDLAEAQVLFAQGKRDLKIDQEAAREAQRRLMARRKFMESLVELFPELLAAEIDDAKPEPPAAIVRPTQLAGGAAAANIAAGAEYRSRLLAAHAANADAPRGKQAALEVLRSRAGMWVTVRAMAEELLSRGWISTDSNDPEAAARQSLYRLAATNVRVEKQTVDGVLSFRYQHPRANLDQAREPGESR